MLIFLPRSHKLKNIATYFLMTRDVSSLNSWSSFWFIYFQQHLKIYSLVLYNSSQTYICWKSPIYRLFSFHCYQDHMFLNTMKLSLSYQIWNKARSRTLKKGQTQVVDIVTISKAALTYKYYPKHRNQFFLFFAD